MRRNCLISKPIGHSSIIRSHPTRTVFRYRNELQSLTNEATRTGKTGSWVDTNWQVSPHGDGSHDIMTTDPTFALVEQILVHARWGHGGALLQSLN